MGSLDGVRVEGTIDGTGVVGLCEGAALGSILGIAVGDVVGSADGRCEGCAVGREVGSLDGCGVGDGDGIGVGMLDGPGDGKNEGRSVGFAVGFLDGTLVGAATESVAASFGMNRPAEKGRLVWSAARTSCRSARGSNGGKATGNRRHKRWLLRWGLCARDTLNAEHFDRACSGSRRVTFVPAPY